MTTAVIVLNWNSAEDTIDCLRSLKRSRPPIHAIVVDNGSEDESVNRIAQSGLCDTLVRNPTNLGFAEGNNVGIEVAMRGGFPIIAVLNNDTVVGRRTFARLAANLPEGELRAVSPAISYFDDPALTWFPGGIVDRGFPRHLQPYEIDPQEKGLRPTEWVTGCCIAARRGTWARAGLFDPRFFLIFEDSDWSLRAKRSGVQLFVVPCSRIRHKVSRSFVTGPTPELGNFYFARNGLRFHARHSRKHLLRFARQWLLRPSLGALAHGDLSSSLALRWFGAVAFMIGQTGRAPGIVEKILATRSTGNG